MSLPETLTLKNAAAATEAFTKLNADGTKANYAMDTATLQEPVLLSIAHTMTSARDGSDRHLVKLTRTVLDSEGTPRTLVMNMTLAVPRLGITSAHVLDSNAELQSFLTATNIGKILKAEL